MRRLARFALGAVANAALASSPVAAPSPDHREPGIESARVWIAPIVPCGTDTECEMPSGTFWQWLERDPALHGTN
jgi:hypothetical protein